MAKGRNQGKKSYKKVFIILGIIFAIIAILVVLAIRAIGKMSESVKETLSNNAVTLETGEIKVITEGIGVVETKDNVTETVDYNVKVNKLHKHNGEKVAAGEVIAEFEPIIMNESIEQLETKLADVNRQLTYNSKSGSTSVKSPTSGRVKKIYVENESSVLFVQENNKSLMEISGDGKLKVEFDATMPMAKGERIQVINGEEHFDGRVQSTNGTRLTVTFDDSDKCDVDAEVRVVNEEGTEIGTGIVACNHPVYITASSGIVESVKVSKNEKISAGRIVLKLKDVDVSDDYIKLLESREELTQKIEIAKEYKAGYLLTAQNDGIISEMTAKVGDEIQAGTQFLKLLDTKEYIVTLKIDELDIHGILVGQSVSVTLDAIENAVYTGEVMNVSLSGENENGVATYKVSVLLKDAKDVLPGMSANGKITVNEKEDVLLIPIEAIETDGDEKKATVVKKDGTIEERTLKLGLTNNSFAEVLEGVKEGEEVRLIIEMQDIYSQMGMHVEE